MFNIPGPLEAFGRLIGNQELKLRAFSAPFFTQADSEKINVINNGGKLILPNSALDYLVNINAPIPMMFQICSCRNPSKITHAGVLEFLAEEGHCYVPSWIMKLLQLTEGDLINLHPVSLPRATYARFKPLSTDFLSVSNPRAVLEVELRGFSSLTKGDTIAVQYNDEVLEFMVMEVHPGRAVNIIECDMNVEFDAPEGYVEEVKTNNSSASDLKSMANLTGEIVNPSASSFTAFSGAGCRLDGKTKAFTSNGSSSATLDSQAKENSLPPLVVYTDYAPGLLNFTRSDYKNRSVMERELTTDKSSEKSQKPFEGRSDKIRG